MKQSTVIRTIDDLVAALGGDTAVAEWLGISQPAVANWKARGEIPTGWHLRMIARLRRDGYRVSPQVFGLTDDEAKELFGRRPFVIGRIPTEDRPAA